MKPPRNRHETASQARTERVDAAAGAALMLLLGLSVALFFIRPMLRHVAELSAPTPPTLRQEFQAGYYPFVCGVNKFPQRALPPPCAQPRRGGAPRSSPRALRPAREPADPAR